MLKSIFIFSILLAIIAYCMHEYSPGSIATLMQYPILHSTTDLIHKYIRLLFDKPTGKSNKKLKKRKERFMTVEELKQYDGSENSKGIYLSLLGQIFNVKKGKDHYGPGGGYAFFTGRDGSRAFVSGDFTEKGLIDDVTGLSSQDLLGLDDWRKFYHKDYKYVGKLIGRYYDTNGEPTEYNHQVQSWIADAYKDKDSQDTERKIFPSCNSEWYPETGSKVWCTKLSGGAERDWVGVPRMLFTPGKSGHRCTCVRDKGPPSGDAHKTPHTNRGDLDHPQLKEYPKCPQEQEWCSVPNTKQ